MAKLPRIYCDMDGVVADFLKFTRNILGTKFKDRFWEDIPEDTFAQLDKMPDADVLWGYIKQFDPICTPPFIITPVEILEKSPIKLSVINLLCLNILLQLQKFIA